MTQRMSHPSLVAAQLAIMEELSYIRKAETPELNYAILRERDVVAAVRPLLVKHGVTMRPIESEFVHHGEFQTARGGWIRFVRAVRTFRFEHEGSKEYHDVEILTESMDSGDKSAGKANTYARKYALVEWLCLESGNDPDEVVAQRDSENGELFQRAYQALMGCATVEDVNKNLAFMLNSKDCNWSHDQVDELKRIAATRSLGLQSGTVKPQAQKGGF